MSCASLGLTLKVKWNNPWDLAGNKSQGAKSEHYTLSVGNSAQSAVSGLKTLQLFSYSNSRLSYLNQQI